MRSFLFLIAFLIPAAASFAQSLPPCTDSLRTSNFGMQLAWLSDDNLQLGFTSTPAIGNLNPAQDSISEIVVVTNKSWSVDLAYEMLFYKGDGSNRDNPGHLPIPEGLVNGYYRGAPTLADLDGNGVPELVVLCADKRVRIYTGYNPAANPVMSLWVTSVDTSSNNQLFIYAADFDQDGIAEVYAGNEIFALDLSTPLAPVLRRRLQGAWSFGRMFTTDPTPMLVGSSFAADLLDEADCGGDPDCAGLELAAGNMIYSVDLNPNDGDGYQIKIQRNISAMSGLPYVDGLTTVADIDLDGIPEVLVSSSKLPVRGHYVWNKTGFNHFFPSDDNPIFLDDGPLGGLITVGNVYDDRKNGFALDYPELLAHDRGYIHCFNLQKATLNPALPYWWKIASAGYYVSASSLFDFDGNGRPEIIYGNPGGGGLHVLYGGATPFPPGVGADRRWMSSFEVEVGWNMCTQLVADVDGDEQAEIVTIGTQPSYNGAPYRHFGLYILEADEIHHSTWTSARRVWNQYAYNIVNVDDDLGIPQVQRPGHLEVPGPGSNQRPFNVALAQESYYSYEHPRHIVTADATIEILEVACQANLQFSIRMRVCNNGSLALPGRLPVTIYRGGNPTLGPSTPIGTYYLPLAPLLPGHCAELTVVLPYTSNNLYAAANDPAIGVFPLVNSDQYWKAECDYTNNVASFRMNPTLGPAVSLGADIHDCVITPHTLLASPGFASYLWQNGSTNPFFVATAPGLYWVQAQDYCSNIRRDTVAITIGTVVQHQQVAVCPGAFYLFAGQQLPAGSNQSFVFSTVSGCDSTVVVEVGTLPSDQTAESVFMCPGDSVLVFNSFVKNAGLFSQHFQNVQGCDSLHTVTVVLYSAPVPTGETRQICPGDSTLVFGNFVHGAGSFSQHFSTLNDCDSLHTVTVSLFTAPVPTEEMRQICAGDSMLVFGSFVNTVGVYSQTFSNENGCDSIHTVTVSLLNAPVPTEETRQICPGDSTLVFGSFINTAGTYSQVFSNVNGCDSTHIIMVSLLNAPVPTGEMRQICPGDSTLVFGSFFHVAGVYSQTFSNANGCDSIHTVTVSLMPVPLPTEEMRQICAGDSTLVFGSFVYAAGSFYQVLSSIAGCDSMHTVTVSLLATPLPTEEMRQICPGDSTLVFGSFVNTAGSFSQTYSNVAGCDSMHTVMVSLLAAPVPTAEMRQICPGDSTLIFGSFVHVAGSFSQHFSTLNDCDSLHTVTVSLFTAPVPTEEMRQICAGDSMLVFGSFVNTAGVYSQTFSNVNGCDSIHTVTVSLLNAPVPTEETRQICPGDSTLVFGSFINTAGTYSQVFSNLNGCDSTHIIMVSLLNAPVPTGEMRQICPGDSTLVFGSFVHVAGSYSQDFSNVNGCDSTHTITVSLLNAPGPTEETRQICSGDSTLVFGSFINTAGVYSQVFSNVNGCDSIHTVTVSLLTTSIPTEETRQICPGDSTLIFGSFINTAGVYSQVFSNVNGCDSMHTVTVNLMPVPLPTEEMRQICPGDSTLVFGSFVNTAGSFSQTYSNVAGCDSMHTVMVSLLAAPVPTAEMRQICPGDSTLIFGSFVHVAGSFSQHFSTLNDCDSLHTVTVSLLSVPIPTEEVRQICPGDSTLVFGSFVNTAGAYSQTLFSTNGCDSIHTVIVSLLSAPIPTEETRQICLGDSTLVFGSFVYAAGSFSQTLSSVAGCDSTHTVTVNVLATPVPTEETRQICSGDSTLVFGSFVHAAGSFSQVFSNVNGCDSMHTIHVIETDLYERGDTVALCSGDSVQVLGKWVFQPGLVQEITAGQGSCDTLWSVAVLGIVQPVVSVFITQPNAQNAPGKIEVSATNGALYSLDGLHFGVQTVFDSLNPGNHILYQEFEGCVGESPFVILPFLEENSDSIFAPNVFAPGSANGNGAFTLYAAPDRLSEVLWLQVYDRWGSLVFARDHFPFNDGSKGWNGFIGGKMAEPGVYFWQAMVEYKDGKRSLKKGDVTLYR